MDSKIIDSLGAAIFLTFGDKSPGRDRITKMKDDDSECKENYQEKKNEQDTGQNNIGKDPFHDVI